jgi:hypothetical protein
MAGRRVDMKRITRLTFDVALEATALPAALIAISAGETAGGERPVNAFQYPPTDAAYTVNLQV